MLKPRSIDYRPVPHKYRSSIRERANKAKPLRSTTVCCVLENPGYVANVANVLRNIDGFGISKLLIISSTPHLFNTQAYPVRKGSKGASCWVYVKVFHTTSDCTQYLRENNYTSIVTSPHTKMPEKNRLLQSVDFTCYKKLAIWFGNETGGVSQEALTQAKLCIQIEMAGMVESLNLACAAAVVLYVVTAQRRNHSRQSAKRVETKRKEKIR